MGLRKACLLGPSHGARYSARSDRPGSVEQEHAKGTDQPQHVSAKWLSDSAHCIARRKVGGVGAMVSEIRLDDFGDQ
jgi:hypothetical protein